MIRIFKESDLSTVMKIWLDTNIDSHNFISKDYWVKNYKMVKSIIPQAEVYVYEDDATRKIHGFIGLSGDHIEGLFIRADVQGYGYGRELLKYVKNIKSNMTLSVYQKNERAIQFYKREGFAVESEKIDDNTNEKEFLMVWSN